jgi:hypothetical protein
MNYRAFILAAAALAVAPAAYADSSYHCNGGQIGIHIDAGRVLVRRDSSAPLGNQIIHHSANQITWSMGSLTVDDIHNEIVFHDEFTGRASTCVRTLGGSPSNF